MRQTIVQGDCVKILRERIHHAKPQFDLCITDPPFNQNYHYSVYKDRRTADDYLTWCCDWIDLIRDCLTPTGSMYVFSGDKHVADLKQILDGAGLYFRSWIIWNFNFGVHQEHNWGLDHQHILYYTRDKKRFTFNADAVRVPSLRQTKYKDKRANPLGRVPGNVWEIPRVCGTFKERTGHSCQTAIDVMLRIIRASSNPGESIIDPMCGSGTSIVAAKMTGRNAFGIELDDKAAFDAIARVKVARGPKG